MRALCFSPCMCLSVSSASSGLAWCLPHRECHSKWAERPLTLTLPAQSRVLLATISRARLPLTQTLSRVAEIKTRLSGSHLEQAPFNPNKIRVTYESHLEDQPTLNPLTLRTQCRQGRAHRQRPSSYHATGSRHCLTLTAPTQHRQNSNSHDKQNEIHKLQCS